MFGPLWTTSAFMFESANYLLKKTFCGSVNHLDLVIERYLRNKSVRRTKIAQDSIADWVSDLGRSGKSFRPAPIKNADLLRLSSTVGVDAECFSTAQLPFFDLDSTLSLSCRNSFVTLKTEKLLVIGQIIVFYNNGSDDMVLVKMYKVIRAHKPQLAFKGLPAAYFEVLETSLQHRFRQSQISDKLLPMPCDGKLFMIPIIKHFEHD